MPESSETTPGKVYLVGAGPGDPGLITMRGVECLQHCDLVLYDYLVNPQVLAHASRAAELVCLGHHSQRRTFSQDEIDARVIEAALQGKTVVRLKGGDPTVFAHHAEETEALVRAHIPFEIVPGVTAALAAAAYAAIPITHGRHSSAVALVTAQQRHGPDTAPLDYAALARFPGTLVFYMGVTGAAEWSRELIRHGKAPDTPTVVVRRCSWPDQQTVRCTLATLAEVVAEKRLRPPAVIVVGEVVAESPAVSWFSSRPLLGVRILVTRPREEAESLRAELSGLGAEMFVQPAIQISDPPDWAPVDAALASLDQFDWLVFSSVHGVRYLLDRLLQRGGDTRDLARARLAAVGPGTADELAKYHLRVDLLPEQYRAESLAEALAREARGRRFLLARASRGREVLAEQLVAAGGEVEQVVAYSNADVDQADPAVAHALAAGRIDWVTVTSSAIARSLVRLFGDNLCRSRLASISPITSEVLRGLGHEPAAEADPHTMAGLIAAIRREHAR